MIEHSVDLKGSCLCGEVSYHVTGVCDKFFYCHCQRCRKATGSAHASNLLFKYDKAEWLTGEKLLKSYKVPDANSFSNIFCGNCGSRMPRIDKEKQFVVVPAGGLDSEPGMKPIARIFENSRAEWSKASDGMICFEEYPE